MKPIRPYLSLDLETTGLNTGKVELLQVGMVLDDGKTPFEELKRWNFLVRNKTINYGEDFAMGMNAWIFKELHDKNTKYDVYSIGGVFTAINGAFGDTREAIREYNKEHKAGSRDKLQLAGKNVAQFDLEILSNIAERNDLYFASDLLQHRQIDVGSVYYEDFGTNASLVEINELTGRGEVSHDALQDAEDVVIAIRKKMGMDF